MSKSRRAVTSHEFPNARALSSPHFFFFDPRAGHFLRGRLLGAAASGNSFDMKPNTCATPRCSFVGPAIAVLLLSGCQESTGTAPANEPRETRPGGDVAVAPVDLPGRDASEPAAPTLLGTSAGPLALAVDDAFVYWTDASGYVFRALKSGGDEVALTPGVGAPGVAIAIDSARVFWAAPQAEKIAEVAKHGGDTTIVASHVKPKDLASDGASLFFPEPFRLMKVPADGGAASMVMGCATQPMVVDAGNVYLPLITGTTLRRVRKEGWSAVELAAFDAKIVSLAQYGGMMFVATADGAVYRVPAGAAGSDAPVKISDGQHVGRIAVDGSGIYATTKGGDVDGQVLRIPFDGGEPTVLAANRHAPGPIALDAEWIYWIDGGHDEIVWHDYEVPTVEPTGSLMQGAVLRIRKR